MKRPMQTALVALTTAALLVAASVPAGAADGGTNLNASESAAAVSKVAPKANVAKPTSGRDRYDAKTKNATVSVPKSVTGDVVLASGGVEFGLGLPVSDAKDANVTSNGTVVYDGKGVDVAVQTLSDGVRVETVIESAGAPTVYEYGLPAGAELLGDAQGHIVGIVFGTAVLGLKPAWAYDANGTPVPTHYEASANGFVQVVDHTATSYAYPVVADPFVITGYNWWFGGDFTAIRATRSDTTRLAAAAGAVTAITTILQLPSLALGPEAMAIVAAVRAGAAGVTAYALSAVALGKCLEVRYYTGPGSLYFLYWGC
jgi:hypothetical protein